MSVGIFTFQGGTLDAIQQNVTTTGTPVVIAGSALGQVRVPYAMIVALSGTPTLVVDQFDGTNTVLVRPSAAMVAGTPYVMDWGITLRKGSFLRVTVSAAVDVTGSTSIPNAQGT